MCQKNTYSGSHGRFRYKFFPEKKEDDETVLVAASYLDHCYEVELDAGRVTTKEFEYSNDGIDAAQDWLSEQYDEFVKSIAV